MLCKIHICEGTRLSASEGEPLGGHDEAKEAWVLEGEVADELISGSILSGREGGEPGSISCSREDDCRYSGHKSEPLGGGAVSNGLRGTS